MADINLTGVEVTLDESNGLQNLATVSPVPPGDPEDANDNDTNLTLPVFFSNRLTALLNAIDSESDRSSAARSVIGSRVPGDETGARNFVNQLNLSADSYDALLARIERVTQRGPL